MTNMPLVDFSAFYYFRINTIYFINFILLNQKHSPLLVSVQASCEIIVPN